MTKKIIVFLCIVLFAWTSVQAKSAMSKNNSKITVLSGKDIMDKQEYSKLVLRLEEINKMEMKNLTREQRHSLRNEVLNIRNRMYYSGGPYIYIGGGTLILIIILLILLL